jgi:hypothetical protein
MTMMERFGREREEKGKEGEANLGEDGSEDFELASVRGDLVLPVHKDGGGSDGGGEVHVCQDGTGKRRKEKAAKGTEIGRTQGQFH